MKHTKGPWFFLPGNRVCTEKGTTIAILQHVWSDPEETKANAKLIAAAPELLEALTDLVYMAEHFPNELSKDHYSVKAAQAIINKAIGD